MLEFPSFKTTNKSSLSKSALNVNYVIWLQKKMEEQKRMEHLMEEQKKNGRTKENGTSNG